MHHNLKIWPEYFQAVQDGNKTFEIRDNRDHGFQKGDTILLEEYDPDSMRYTGRKIDKLVTYVTDFGQEPGYVVFAIADVEIT